MTNCHVSCIFRAHALKEKENLQLNFKFSKASNVISLFDQNGTQYEDVKREV